MDDWLQFFAAILASFMASSGFWAFFTKHIEKRSKRTRLLIGLAHDRITYLGLQYIHRGWITQDEYENLHDYLYVPYKANGGNGSAEKVMHEVEKLPIKTLEYKMEANSQK